MSSKAVFGKSFGLPIEADPLSNGNPAMPLRISTRTTLVASEVFNTYWRFAAERQAIFFKRLRNELPTTIDPILSEYKFTNAYRASDRVSQYLIRNVAYSGDQSPNELFFRIIVFKLFNKIATWDLLKSHFGEITFKEFRFELYDRVLSDALDRGTRIYSAAYIMPSGGRNGDGRKHRSHLQLLQRMMADEVPVRIASSRKMRDVFELLRSYPMMGDFLAFQFATDLNYSALTDFDEMDFVVAGPGAKDGLKKCFPDSNSSIASEIIHYMTQSQDEHFKNAGVDFKSLWGRRLQPIDCQNLFCEVDKYSREAHRNIKGTSGRTKIKQRFTPNPLPLLLFYPPKWKLNESIPPEQRAPIYPST